MNPAHRQTDHTIRFEWGPTGAEAIADDCDVALVVDVLSFTTTLSVALDAGIEVVPSRPDQATAAAYAEQVDATLAVGRSVARGGQISLSPLTIRRQEVPPQRLVLPSPNGSAISCQLAGRAETVIGASLRTADAVAEWITSNQAPDATVAVIAAGERWPDGSLRPAIEDLWGAGAVLHALAERGWADGFSSEARAAADAWGSVCADLVARLHDCASGVELIRAGYPDDVAIASEVDASSSVPVLRGDRFISAEGRAAGIE